MPRNNGVQHIMRMEETARLIARLNIACGQAQSEVDLMKYKLSSAIVASEQIKEKLVPALEVMNKLMAPGYRLSEFGLPEGLTKHTFEETIGMITS